MLISVKKLISSILVFGLFGAAFAEEKNFVKLKSEKNSSYYVSTGKLNHRVGNAIWVKVFWMAKVSEANMVFDTLLGCDGTWMTNDIRYVIENTASKKLLYALSEQAAMEHPPSLVRVTEEGFLYEKVGINLKRMAKKLCTQARHSAGKEKLLPVSFGEDPSAKNQYVSSIILDTARKDSDGNIVVWTQRTYYKEYQMRESDGSLSFYEGSPVMQKNFEGEDYVKIRRKFDCKAGSTALLSVAEYSGTEPPRILRRLRYLRQWSHHEQNPNQIYP